MTVLEEQGPKDPLPDRTPSPPPKPTRTDSPLAGCLKTIAVVALCVAGLVLVMFVVVAWQLGQSFKTPDPVKAPVMWRSLDVALTPSHSVVHGRLSIRSSATAGVVTLGLNAGAAATPAPPPANPSQLGSNSPAPSASPAGLGAALSTHPVRLGATDGQNGVQQCDAPCELKLKSLTCATDSCAATFDFTVELLEGAAGGDVTVTVSGGGSGRLGDAFPAGFSVDLALESPAASGGQ